MYADNKRPQPGKLSRLSSEDRQRGERRVHRSRSVFIPRAASAGTLPSGTPPRTLYGNRLSRDGLRQVRQQSPPHGTRDLPQVPTGQPLSPKLSGEQQQRLSYLKTVLPDRHSPVRRRRGLGIPHRSRSVFTPGSQRQDKKAGTPVYPAMSSNRRQLNKMALQMLPGPDDDDDDDDDDEEDVDDEEEEEEQEDEATKAARKEQEKQELRTKREELLRENDRAEAYGKQLALAQYLKTVPVFRQLSRDDLIRIAVTLRVENYEPGQTVIQQGDIGKGFFIIKHGQARIYRTEGEKKKRVVTQLDVIQEGDYFGEAALLTNQARGATVEAVGSLICLVLDRQHFSTLFAGVIQKVEWAKRKGVHATRGDTFRRQSAQIRDVAKSEKVMKLVYNAVKDNVLFSGMAYYGVLKVISKMWRVQVPKGETLIHQGNVGANFYVVEKGKFHVFIQTADGTKSRKVDTIGKKECFGELALMYNTPRSATILCRSKAVLWAVDRFTFRRVLRNVSSRKLHEYEQFLKHVRLLAPLSASERAQVAQALDEQKFRAGQTIVQQSDEHLPGDECVYIINRGKVKVERTTPDGTTHLVKSLGRADYFGERALIKNEPRSATVTCLTPVEVLKLDRHAFTLLLGPLEDILNKKVQDMDQRDIDDPKGLNRRSSTTSVNTMTRRESLASMGSEKPHIHRENLVVVGTLGKGSFGSVQLVKDTTTGETYALKRVSKGKVTKAKHQAHIMNEKRMLSRLDHPNIIALAATYKDKQNLYFLLEPVLGGELFTVLRAHTIFDNNTAKFFVASVCLAFEYMHSLNIIFRDLKPENCLMDSKGFLKIADFGFAKELDRDGRTFTLCGTPAYLAPEIIAGRSHGKGVDWWCMGIFIYELLAGFTPFHMKEKTFNAMKLYERIAVGKYSCPSHFSEHAVDIISKFLVRRPTKRLGVIQGGASKVRAHSWLATFDWAGLENGNIRPPIIPFISDNTDMSNFTTGREDTHDIRNMGSYRAEQQWDEEF